MSEYAWQRHQDDTGQSLRFVMDGQHLATVEPQHGDDGTVVTLLTPERMGYVTVFDDQGDAQTFVEEVCK